MHIIQSSGYQLELGSIVESSFIEKLKLFSNEKIVLFADEHTSEACVGFLISHYDQLSEAEVIVIPAGELSKTVEIVENIWEVLSDYQIGRHDLLINVGGGMITDMGGFIASCYKRGIEFINIPTSLLGMVDASIGGKTGVNLGHFKNQIGVFSYPIAVYIDPLFLLTLPEAELMSGYAELLKHGLISDVTLYKRVLEQMEDPASISMELLKDGIEIKNNVVTADPLEKGERKKLNFGHTFGHVIEGFYLGKKGVSHGWAVAIGMIFESYLSYKRGLLKFEDFQEIERDLLKWFKIPSFSDDDVQQMVDWLLNDKKNRSGKIQCCLLEGMGKCTFDHEISLNEAMEVFLHFKNQQINLN
ncbi:MAG: 3-dehydroquinate synthase [Crocinitomicaceae bacterium]|nr:3-dehydroquinate synthase [Flavobacteriales bacterium]NQZ35055.1 3-dehydroquinate synthase [Crocinitomicaceae bacterium]